MKFDYTIDEQFSKRRIYAGKKTSVSNLVEGGDIPLSPKIMKKIFGGKTVSSFHITALDKLNQLKKLEGRRASLASFNKLKNSVDKLVPFIYSPLTDGGVFVWIEGNMVSKFSSDAFTLLDKGGRRWVSWNTLIDKNEVKYPNELIKLSKEFAEVNKNGTKSEKQQSIKNYVSAAYKYIIKYKDEIVEKSISTEIEDSSDMWSKWNEILLNKIRVKGLVILNPSVHKHISQKKVRNSSESRQKMNQREFNAVLREAKRLFPGVKIIVTKDTKAFKKYFKKWGGDLVLDHYII